MVFGSLALIMLAGLTGPILAAAGRFAPPVVVGQILAGVVIGTSGLGWVDASDPVLNGFALVGFALLMFIVGTHLPLRDRHLRPALTRGAVLALITAAGAAITALLLSQLVGLHRPGILAVLLATSSGAVALPVLQGLGENDPKTMAVTAWIVMADVGTVLALPVVLSSGSVIRVLLGGLAVVVAGAMLVLIATRLRGVAVVGRIRRMSHQRGWGLDLRVSLLALFGCGWLATAFGTSILVAGFTVGAVVAILGEPRRVADQLVGIGEGFAIPLFFVHLGSQLDLGALFRSPDSLTLAGGLAAAGVAIHVAVALLARLPLGAGLLASAQLGVPAAVVSIGLSSGQLTAGQAAAIMAAALASLGACAVGSALVGHVGRLGDASAPTPRSSAPL